MKPTEKIKTIIKNIQLRIYENKDKYNLDPVELKFMKSLSASVLVRSPDKIRTVLLFWIVFVVLFLLWAALAPINELVRGDGKVIPGGENQMIQHLEGGIIKEILVKEGQKVQANDILLKIDNVKSSSTFESSQYKYAQLRAKIVRLQAEANGTEFTPTAEDLKNIPLQIEQEKSLFISNKELLSSQLSALNNQLIQKTTEKREVESRMSEQKRSLGLIKEEIAMSEPMVAQGIKSKVEFLRLKREGSNIEEQYNVSVSSIPRLNAAINEINNKIKEAKSSFASKAKQSLSESETEYKRVGAESVALEDQVVRNAVRSPINGVVQRIFVNTVGGVIKPGDNLIEIVPTEGGLLVEAKVKPSDIAFLYPGQKAIVKVSAYDFAIYGSLEGTVVNISPDTVTDKKDNIYYVVKIQTNKKYLGDAKKPLKIIPGMTVNVDIVTGEKSVLSYILKPLLRAKEYTFSER